MLNLPSQGSLNPPGQLELLPGAHVVLPSWLWPVVAFHGDLPTSSYSADATADHNDQCFSEHTIYIVQCFARKGPKVIGGAYSITVHQTIIHQTLKNILY